MPQTRQQASQGRRQTEPMKQLDIIHALSWEDLPTQVRRQAMLCLLDLLGVAAGGRDTDMARIARAHAAEDMPGDIPLLFSDRRANAAAGAMGWGIDSLDGHDGYNPAKGHVGAVLLAGMLALAPRGISGQAFLTTLVMGYEVGARLAEAQHASCPDYHTSGSWGAVVARRRGRTFWGWIMTPPVTRRASRSITGHAAR